MTNSKIISVSRNIIFLFLLIIFDLFGGYRFDDPIIKLILIHLFYTTYIFYYIIIQAIFSHFFKNIESSRITQAPFKSKVTPYLLSSVITLHIIQSLYLLVILHNHDKNPGNYLVYFGIGAG